jgi:flagellar basal body-associated protein FliL
VTDESVELWIIILAVIGTVLLLTVAIAVMRHLGFFKRSKKLQLAKQKEKMDSLAKKSPNSKGADL